MSIVISHYHHHFASFLSHYSGVGNFFILGDLVDLGMFWVWCVGYLRVASVSKLLEFRAYQGQVEEGRSWEVLQVEVAINNSSADVCVWAFLVM